MNKIQDAHMKKQRAMMHTSLGLNKERSTPHGYPGLLPTLGLKKYTNVDLNLNKSNPYVV